MNKTEPARAAATPFCRTVHALPALRNAAVADSGRIRTGDGIRILPSPRGPANVADTGRIRTGDGIRVLPSRSKH